MIVLYPVVPFGPSRHAQSGRRVLAHRVEGGDDRGRGVSPAGGGAGVDGHEGVQARVLVEHAAVAGVDAGGSDGDGTVRKTEGRK